MSIPIDNLNLPAIITGFPNFYPDLRPMVTTATLAEITTPGWLNNGALSTQPVSPFSLLPIIYGYVEGASSQTMGWFQVSITRGIVTLYPMPGVSGDGNVKTTLPSTATYMAVFSDTNGTVTSGATTAINPGNIQAGLSGTAGALIAFPATPNTGELRIFGTSNAGNTVCSLTNAPMGQISVLYLTDPGTTNGYVQVSTAPSDPCSNLFWVEVNVDYTQIASGGLVTILADIGTKQYRVRDIYLESGTNFAGGDRNVVIINSLTTYTSISPTLLQAQVNSRWGQSADFTILNLTTATVPSSNITLGYGATGTTDYTSGNMKILIQFERVI